VVEEHSEGYLMRGRTGGMIVYKDMAAKINEGQGYCARSSIYNRRTWAPLTSAYIKIMLTKIIDVAANASSIFKPGKPQIRPKEAYSTGAI
jgi:hypothetical protein